MRMRVGVEVWKLRAEEEEEDEEEGKEEADEEEKEGKRIRLLNLGGRRTVVRSMVVVMLVMLMLMLMLRFGDEVGETWRFVRKRRKLKRRGELKAKIESCQARSNSLMEDFEMSSSGRFFRVNRCNVMRV